MTTPNEVTTFTWKLPNASTISNHTNSDFFYINGTTNGFYLKFYPSSAVQLLDGYVTIYLFRCDSFAGNIKVSFLNQTGDKCETKKFKAEFRSQDSFYPRHGGIYIVKRDFLFDKSNGLFDGNGVKIICEIKILDQDQKSNKSIIKIQVLSREVASNDFNSLLEGRKFSDILLVFRGHELSAHKNILSARSPVFAAMFEHDCEKKNNRVEIPDVEVQTFKHLLRFIYTGNCSQSALDENASDLLIAADKYELMSLKEICEEVLATNLSVDNACSMLQLADMHNALNLKDKCLNYITKHSVEVMATDGWTKLSKEILLQLYADIAHKTKDFLKQ